MNEQGKRNSRWAGYWHLLLARIRELQREPEVVFWVFGFPILLAIGLGIAFRNKPADATRIAIVSGPAAQHVVALLSRAPDPKAIHADVLDEPAAVKGFRFGKYDLLVRPLADGAFQYEFDPARPESALARVVVDDALQAASGRKNSIATSASVSMDPGSRYIDFLIPGSSLSRPPKE